MPIGRDKDAERRAEAAFNQQQELLQQQQAFLQSQSATAQNVLQLLEDEQAGIQGSADLAQQALADALEGNPTESQLQFEQDIRNRGAENIRRNLGIGGETSTPGIEINREIEEAIAASRDFRRQGDIGAAVSAGQLTSGQVSTNLEQQLAAAFDPLRSSQVLGQSTANLGKLSQFSQQRDPFLQDIANIGGGALSFLGSQPNAIQNIGGNLKTIGNLFKGAFSDERLKDNVRDTDVSLDTVKKIKVRDYEIFGKEETGIIAQELNEIVPSVVYVGGDPTIDPWRIDYAKLTPLLIKAVQELSEKVVILEEEKILQEI